MKKVCHITSVHQRYDVRIFQKMCVSLSASNYDVTLLVMDTLPNEVKSGVKIVSVGFHPKNRYDRLVNSRRHIFRQAIELDCDVYHLHDPELMPLASRLIKQKKKVIFDSHEDIPGQISEKSWIPKYLRKTVSCIYSIYEQHMLRKISGVIGARESDQKRFAQCCSHVTVITNYPIVHPLPSGIVKQTNAFSYAGGITKQWNHDIVLNALDHVNATYELMGKVEDDYLHMLQSKPSWSKVNFYGKVPFQDAQARILSSVAGIALLQYGANTNWHEGNLANTKLFECMLAEIPVICTDFTVWSQIINQYQCGLCIKPQDTQALIEAMQWILDHPSDAVQMGKRGRQAVEQVFNWSSQSDKLKMFYSSLFD